MEKDNRYPSIGQALILLLIGVVSNLLVNLISGAIIGGVIGFKLASSGKEIEEINLIVQQTINNNLGYLAIMGVIISSIVLIFIALKKREVKLTDFLLKNKEAVDLKLFVIIAFIAIGLVLFSGEVVGFIMALLKVSPSTKMSLILKGLPGIILGLILAPFFEEIIFRGVILGGLESRYSATKAAVISALFFSIYHFNLFQLLPTFLLGLFLAYLYLQTKSVLVCVYTHFIYNFSPIVMLQMQSKEELSRVPIIEKTDYLIFLIAILLLTGGITLLVKYFNQAKEEYLGDISL